MNTAFHILDNILRIRQGLISIYLLFIKNIYKKQYGFIHKSAMIGVPINITNKKNVYIYENTKIQQGLNVITYTGKFILKKYSVISYNCTIVTGNHTPTVGIPLFSLVNSHKNDKEKDVIIEEDVWVGANVTMLSKTHLCRGCIIGANSLVNKEIPPYAVAAGNPIKIIGSKFTLEQTIEHERKIYPKEERFSKEYLVQLFEEHYKGLKSLGINEKQSIL